MKGQVAKGCRHHGEKQAAICPLLQRIVSSPPGDRNSDGEKNATHHELVQ
jgi:hypothetical protein